ncbi:hypothetical protein DDI_3562 [Dickeya dianthicola RNS04.9]|nr:hypothetical protein DDI_3562 [Dickeya dianthicola RNS04.9]
MIVLYKIKYPTRDNRVKKTICDHKVASLNKKHSKISFLR